jgi:hypothetical protein
MDQGAYRDEAEQEDDAAATVVALEDRLAQRTVRVEAHLDTRMQGARSARSSVTLRPLAGVTNVLAFSQVGFESR